MISRHRTCPSNTGISRHRFHIVKLESEVPSAQRTFSGAFAVEEIYVPHRCFRVKFTRQDRQAGPNEQTKFEIPLPTESFYEPPHFFPLWEGGSWAYKVEEWEPMPDAREWSKLLETAEAPFQLR
jgi:hypothetical protein